MSKIFIVTLKNYLGEIKKLTIETKNEHENINTNRKNYTQKTHTKT